MKPRSLSGCTKGGDAHEHSPGRVAGRFEKGLSDTFQREQIISEDERLRSLESAVQKNICTLHDLPPDDVIVSGRKDAPGVFTFIITERTPEIVFTFDADSFHEHE